MTLRAQAGQALREKWAARERQDSPGVEGSRPPRVFGFFLRVEKETAPPRAVAAKEKSDVMKASA